MIDLHTAGDKKPSENWKGYQLPTYLSYIVLRTRANPSLTNCEDLTMALIRNEALNAVYMHAAISINFVIWHEKIQLIHAHKIWPLF